ncbi:MAG: hypothetical protein JW864_08390 [Spirochaetes bacterium]|nr:hypothetical protein [Spirochaetota bacterium]
MKLHIYSYTNEVNGRIKRTSMSKKWRNLLFFPSRSLLALREILLPGVMLREPQHDTSIPRGRENLSKIFLVRISAIFISLSSSENKEGTTVFGENTVVNEFICHR